jgi:hypothetical protein
METSALDCSNIQEAFKQIILEIFLNTIKNNINEPNKGGKRQSLSNINNDGKIIKIHNDSDTNSDKKVNKKGCC